MARASIPFFERVGCSVDDAVAASSLGRTKLFQLMAEKRLESTLIDGRRVICVRSLRRLIEGGGQGESQQAA